MAAPLERHLGQIADVNEMTSSSALGSTRITLQFGLDRDIDGAARDVQAAIVAARADLSARVDLPKFVELDYLDKSYGQPYSENNNSADGYANRRWDYADGGQVLAMEISDAQGFLITISAKSIPPQ